MEKKAKQFDRIVGEWKGKVDSIGMDLDTAQKETKNASSDLFRVKAAYEESVLQLDEVRRENKCLSNEIKDIMDQISEGGRSIHEIDKIRKRLEAEKLELQAALEEAEGALEQEENKVLRAQLELTQVRQEIERRIAEKEEEFASTQKNMGKSERRIKELTYQQDEDRKNHERMQALIDQLQGKIKSYKKQIEEAEEIAALNLAKYRQAQNSVADATERADSNEQTLAKNRARARSASIGPM